MPDRMSLEDAQAALGHYVAFNAHGGDWVTGRLVGVADTPQLFVERPDGSQGVYTLSTVDGWAVSDKEYPVAASGMDVLPDSRQEGK